MMVPRPLVIGSYLDSISDASARLGGPGLLGHLDSLGGRSIAIVHASTPDVMGYLDALRYGTTDAPSTDTVQNYIELPQPMMVPRPLVATLAN